MTVGRRLRTLAVLAVLAAVFAATEPAGSAPHPDVPPPPATIRPITRTDGVEGRMDT